MRNEYKSSPHQLVLWGSIMQVPQSDKCAKRESGQHAARWTIASAIPICRATKAPHASHVTTNIINNSHRAIIDLLSRNFLAPAPIQVDGLCARIEPSWCFLAPGTIQVDGLYVQARSKPHLIPQRQLRHSRSPRRLTKSFLLIFPIALRGSGCCSSRHALGTCGTSAHHHVSASVGHTMTS